MAVKFKCLCCGFEKVFKGAEEAFAEGWDIPPYFTQVQPLCNLCPAAEIAIHGLEAAQKRHEESHKRWAKDGRPKEFEFANELTLDGVKQEKIPTVHIVPEMQAEIDANPELKEAMKKFTVDAKNAMQAVKGGRYPDFGKAMEALGYEMERHITEEDDESNPVQSRH